MVSPCSIFGKLSEHLTCEIRAVDPLGYDLTTGFVIGFLFLCVVGLLSKNEGSR